MINNSLNLEIPFQIYKKAETHSGRRRIRRLPPVLRDGSDLSKHNYDPKVISFGPFHHGQPHLQLGQTFKHKALQSFLSATGKDKSFFLNTIAADIDAIRGCYDEATCHEFHLHDDEAFAEMMLLDGCFIVSIMELLLSNSDSLIDVLYAVGLAGFSYAVSDMFLLENQIPYRVITLLLQLRYEDNINQGLDLLDDFLTLAAFQGNSRNRKSGMKEESSTPPPIHLLEAIRRKLVTKPDLLKDQFALKLKEPRVHLGTRIYTSRSVTDLKAKGIDFTPSPSGCLRDVSFASSLVFYGNLRLPRRCISEKTKVLFTNLVAYEISPENVNDYAVSSYVHLVKSLVHSAGDVKELREKKVFISNMGSDEEVFEVLKEIGTCGMENASIFHEVKEMIEEHYNNRAKTWMAELVHTYFESPWTAIALMAAILLLLLTFLQTYFTIHPSHF